MIIGLSVFCFFSVFTTFQLTENVFTTFLFGCIEVSL